MFDDWPMNQHEPEDGIGAYNALNDSSNKSTSEKFDAVSLDFPWS